MNQELRQLDILIGATQYQIRKAQEIFDSSALISLQAQYSELIHKRSVLIGLYVIPSVSSEVSHEQ